MIVGEEANKDSDVMLKTKRTIKANITHKIKVIDSELQNSPAERPERLAMAAATYLKGLIDFKLEEVINDRKCTDQKFLLILTAVKECFQGPDQGEQFEEWSKYKNSFDIEWQVEKERLYKFAVSLEQRREQLMGNQSAGTAGQQGQQQQQQQHQHGVGQVSNPR